MQLTSPMKELDDLYVLRPKRIAAELVFYALIAWSAFFIAAQYKSALAFVIATIFMYRGLGFIHEVSHLTNTLPWVRLLFNTLFGYPNRVPAYSMENHRYHHAPQSFGTIEDPEYERWTARPKYHLARPLLLSFFYPLFLTLRFGIWPLFYVALPDKFQIYTYEKLSTFVMNLRYIRPFDQEKFRKVVQEDLFCSLYFLLFCSITIYAGFFQQFYFTWYLLVIVISLMNTYRALVAHRYTAHQDDKGTGKKLNQLVDSVTIEGSWLTEIWAPIGLRYHSTHHFLPTLPYYSLREAHRRLKRLLPAQHPYHQTIEKSFYSAFRKLFLSCGSGV